MSATKQKGITTMQTYQHQPSASALRFDFAKGIAYDNVYPSLSRIANEFMTIRPFAIDANGKPLNKANAIDALYHPNTKMSGADFREALAVTALTHRKAYILVWHWEGNTAVPGGQITDGNIAGFTFIEDAIIKVDQSNFKTYQVYKNGVPSETYTQDEVIEISAALDPYNLDAGYSPTQSAKKWANIDDFIASYEAGHFENGAKPAGIFTITAPTVDAFNDAVDRIQAKHRGAGNNNNPLYVHNPVNPDTGVALGTTVEWTPFTEANNTLALGEIFSQANDKIDSAFGVPASIRGVNDNNTYASVKVDERIFIRYTVRPFATKIWAKFTHELNRITGGLGYAISFDIEEPSVADEEKADAERKATELAIIEKATTLGYSLDSIVEAFDLSNSYKLLKLGEPTNATIINDKPEVDEDAEVQDAPDEKAKEIPTHCTCNHDHSHDHKEKATAGLKAISGVLSDYIDTIIDKTIEANRTDSAKAIETEEIDDETYEEYQIAQPTEESNTALRLAILAVLFAQIRKSGQKTLKKEIAPAIDLAALIASMEASGTPVPEALKSYIMSDKLTQNYESRISDLALSFTNQILDNAREAVAEASASAIIKAGEQGLSRAETIREIRKESELAMRQLPERTKYIVNRIADTEEHRAYEAGRTDAIDWVISTTQYDAYKIWKIRDESACEFCKSMDGTKVKFSEAFVPIGDTIEGTDGGTLLNDYEQMDTPQAHAYCRCDYKIEWVKAG